MIQAAQVASKFTLFTHHAKTFPDLVTALRNSMLRAGVFKDEKTAEEQVVQVLNFDIHLVKDFRGNRYIERVTECIPVEERNEYTFEHRREKTLEELAVKVAKSVVRTGKSITLEPMTAYERKIIHSKLQENNRVETHSVGEEPRRRIVIEKR